MVALSGTTFQVFTVAQMSVSILRSKSLCWVSKIWICLKQDSQHKRTGSLFIFLCSSPPTLKRPLRFLRQLGEITHKLVKTSLKANSGWIMLDLWQTYCGWTKSCTTLNPWENLACRYLQGNHNSQVSERWCEMDFATIQSTTYTNIPWKPTRNGWTCARHHHMHPFVLEKT